MPGRYWRVPRGWAGQPAFILGGGASLIGFGAARLLTKGRVFAVNDAGLYLAPFADVLYFADGNARWYGWNRDKLDLFKGQYVVTRSSVPQRLRLQHDEVSGLSRNPSALAGACGGANALNLAYLFGCDPIYLLGFDMGGGHWHDNHNVPTRDRYATHFIPALERMAIELASDRVRVFNCNPDSALRCFPFADIDEVLHA